MLVFYLAMLKTEEERAKMKDIYEEYQPVMLKCACLYTKNKEMAEDAVHNAILSIKKHKNKYLSLPSNDLRKLLVIMTKNKCIDLLRKHSYFVDDQIDEIEHILVANDAPIEDQVILGEEYELIQRLIETPDETSRLVLEALLFKWLNRRSQKRSYTWEGFREMLRFQ